jgi:hypothetical protein
MQMAFCATFTRKYNAAGNQNQSMVFSGMGVFRRATIRFLSNDELNLYVVRL